MRSSNLGEGTLPPPETERVGAEIAAVISENLFGKLKAPVKRLGAPFTPVPFSKPLETAFLPSAQQIAETAIALARA